MVASESGLANGVTKSRGASTGGSATANACCGPRYFSSLPPSFHVTITTVPRANRPRRASSTGHERKCLCRAQMERLYMEKCQALLFGLSGGCLWCSPSCEDAIGTGGPRKTLSHMSSPAGIHTHLRRRPKVGRREGNSFTTALGLEVWKAVGDSGLSGPFGSRWRLRTGFHSTFPWA